MMAIQNDERMLFEARLHWVIFCWPAIIFILGFIAYIISPFLMYVAFMLLAVGVISFLVNALSYHFSSLRVSKKRLLLQSGVLVRKITDIPIARIETVDTRQTILGSLLGYGSIIITGTGGTHSYIHQISNPLGCRRHIEQFLV